MPTLTRWFIKTAMIYFILALLAGILIAGQGVWASFLPSLGLFPDYIHLLVVGWLTMLILGVAYWMFPKFTKEKPRGSQGLGWAAYILLNTGLLFRVISEPVSSPGSAWSWILVISAVLQWLGGMAFVANTWLRVVVKNAAR